MSRYGLNTKKIALGVAGAALAALALAGCSSGAGGSGAGDSGASGGSAPKTSTSTGGSASAADGDTLKTAQTSLGTVIVDGTGMTVYYFDKDTKGETASTCTGQCAQFWPPVTTTSTPMLTGVTGTVGTIAGPNGTKQVTLDGMPLYTYGGDQKPGDVTGQGSTGFGAGWWVVAPDGAKITQKAAAQSDSGYSY